MSPTPAPAAPEPAAAVPLPGTVRVAGVLVGVQGIGVLVLAVLIAVSGFHHGAAVGQLLAQVAFFVVVAAGLAACGHALLTGRRWGRSPGIVVQVIALAVGYWLAGPSDRVGPGLAVIGYALITGGLLLTPAANKWANQFALPGRSVPVPPAAPVSARKAAPVRSSRPVTAGPGTAKTTAPAVKAGKAGKTVVSPRPARTRKDPPTTGASTANGPKKGPKGPGR